MARQIRIPQKNEKSALSSFSNFSGSSTTLSSASKHLNQEQAVTGTNFLQSKYATFARENPQQLRSLFLTKKSTPSGYKSSPTSYLPSQRPSRSRSSHSPVKRRAESPTGKDPSSRHGWLYTQQCNSPTDLARVREDRLSNNNTVR
jgi:hypothetical protein